MGLHYVKFRYTKGLYAYNVISRCQCGRHTLIQYTVFDNVTSAQKKLAQQNGGILRDRIQLHGVCLRYKS